MVLTPHRENSDVWRGSFNLGSGQSRRGVKLSRDQAVLSCSGTRYCYCLAFGSVLYNTSGNQGLSKAGSGGMLTGLMASLLAEDISRVQRRLLFLHGWLRIWRWLISKMPEQLLPKSSCLILSGLSTGWLVRIQRPIKDIIAIRQYTTGYKNVGTGKK